MLEDKMAVFGVNDQLLRDCLDAPALIDLTAGGGMCVCPSVAGGNAVTLPHRARRNTCHARDSSGAARCARSA